MNAQIKNEIICLIEKTEIKKSNLIQKKVNKLYMLESLIFFITITLVTILLFTINV